MERVSKIKRRYDSKIVYTSTGKDYALVASEGIGDFIHSTVIYKMIKTKDPEIKVDFGSPNESLRTAVSKWGIFNRVLTDKEIYLSRSNYKAIVYGRHCYSDITKEKNPQVWLVPNRDEKGKMQRESVYLTNIKFMETKGFICAEDTFPFWVVDSEYSKKAEETIKDLKKPIIGIHSSRVDSFWFRRRWPSNYWRELTEKLPGTCIRFGSSSDWKDRGIIKAYSVDTSEDLQLLAAIISKCDLFIGSETGLVKIAEVLGVPAIVLSGPTGKIGKINATYLTPREDICSNYPCYLLGGDRGDESIILNCVGKENSTPCMKAISVDIVMEEVKKVLSV